MFSQKRKATYLLIIVCSFVLSLIITTCEKQKEQHGTQNELVIVSYGGAFQDAQREAFFEPFARQYNVKVKEETHTGDLAKIKAMVESGNVVWDVIDVETHMVLRGAKQNLYEKLDYSVIPKDQLIPESIHDYGVANCTWSTVMAYNTNNFNDRNVRPNNWVDFWDTQKYPGPRSLRKSPISTLEFALLADGVEKNTLYPLDVDRAFRSLDKIKSNIIIWWDAGEQPAQLLSSGEIILTSAWNGRIYNARKDGKPVHEVWDGGLIDSDWWVIPKGSKNKDLAMKFIAFSSQPGPQANFPKFIPYGPVNKNAVENVPPEILKDIPTAPQNIKDQIFINSEYWDLYQSEIQEKWEKWLIK